MFLFLDGLLYTAVSPFLCWLLHIPKYIHVLFHKDSFFPRPVDVDDGCLFLTTPILLFKAVILVEHLLFEGLSFPSSVWDDSGSGSPHQLSHGFQGLGLLCVDWAFHLEVWSSAVWNVSEREIGRLVKPAGFQNLCGRKKTMWNTQVHILGIVLAGW